MNDQTLIGIYTLTLMGVMLLFLFCLVVYPEGSFRELYSTPIKLPLKVLNLITLDMYLNVFK